MSKGLTIIEIIITIFLLSVAVVGIYSAFSVLVALTSDAADSFTAAYLAQEGVEIARNVRDYNWIKMVNDSNAKWTDGLLDNCLTGCEVDYKTGTPGNPNPGERVYSDLDYLNIDANGFYVYNNSANPIKKFKRKVTITCFPSNNCAVDHIMKVSVQVFWNKKPTLLDLNPSSNPSKYSIISEEYFYNWF